MHKAFLQSNQGPMIGEPHPIEAPHVYSDGFMVASLGNDIVMSLTRSTMNSDGSMITAVPVVVVNLSRGTLKELAMLANHLVSRLEADFGTIDTPFLRQARDMTEEVMRAEGAESRQ